MTKKIKAVRGWCAKNPGKLEIDNISLFKTKREAISQYGGRQEIIPVLITPINKPTK